MSSVLFFVFVYGEGCLCCSGYGSCLFLFYLERYRLWEFNIYQYLEFPLINVGYVKFTCR